MQSLLNEVEKEVINRAIPEEFISQILQNSSATKNRRIIGGYASCDIIDREGQRIPIYALENAVKRFMSNIYYRPAQIFHSDIQVGRVLPKWTNPETGETVRTRVDDTGWWVCIELRDDIEVANKVWDEVLKGNIRSFSIAGSSKDKLRKQENGVNYEEVADLDVAEVTLCETPVNSLAKFSLLWYPEKVQI